MQKQFLLTYELVNGRARISEKIRIFPWADLNKPALVPWCCVVLNDHNSHGIEIFICLCISLFYFARVIGTSRFSCLYRLSRRLFWDSLTAVHLLTFVVRLFPAAVRPHSASNKRSPANPSTI